VSRSVSSSAARTAVLVVVLSIASLAAPATSAAPDRTGRSGAAASSSVRIVTYNVGAKNSPARTMEDLAKIFSTNPDIVALQEMSSPEKRRSVAERYVDCEDCRWGAYMPGPAVPGETPVLFRSDRLKLLDARTVQLTEPTYVGQWGAGPATIRAKFVTWVRLLDLKSGRMVNILNNHTVPSVQDKSGRPNHRSPARLKIYRKHLAGVKSLVRTFVEERRGLVFVTGDLNVNYRRDKVLSPPMFPYSSLGEVGLRASYEALGEPPIGTHVLRSGNSTRLIDYVYYRPGRTVEAYEQRVLTGFASDHRPLLAEFQVTRRPASG
jgi:endonuclease/exonuclease/phosphatase (EEP) superfamily protein YafD